jgi:hypothetical protein
MRCLEVVVWPTLRNLILFDIGPRTPQLTYSEDCAPVKEKKR